MINKEAFSLNSLVSVIIPVYNVERYIADSIRSICTQSYRNIEIIVVDDGTIDKSIEIATEVLSQFDIMSTIIHQKNSGLPAARNTGLRAAKGDYVCFIDSDDIIACNHIENAVLALNQGKYRVVYSDFEYTSERNRLGSPTVFNGTESLDREELFKLFSERTIKIHCCSLLMSTELLIINDLWFNEKLRYGEDVDFMWRLFSVSNGIEHAMQVSYKYLIRNNSIMSSQSFDKWMVFVPEFKKTIDNLYLEYPYNGDTYKYVYYRTLLGLLHTVAKNTSLKSFKEFCSLIDYKNIYNELIKSGSFKTRLSAVLLLNKVFFYYIVRRA